MPLMMADSKLFRDIAPFVFVKSQNFRSFEMKVLEKNLIFVSHMLKIQQIFLF